MKNNNETYGFTWYGKRGAIAEASQPVQKKLHPCAEDSIDWDTTENLYIEGDNLDVLKLLRENYSDKIKMCYIDPPYNTGNDFIYNDKHIHDDWRSMMYSRLVLTRNLLTPDGVIFISIDDGELAQLKMICDEIFGENNYIGVLSVENNPKGRKNSSFISVSSEFCVIYAKQKENAHFIENIPKKASDMTKDENGNFVHKSGKRVLVGENSFNNYVTNKNSDKNYSVYYRACDKQLQILKEEYGEINSDLTAEGYINYSSRNNGKLVENTYTESKFRELFEIRALQFTSDKIYEKNFNDTVRIKSQLTNRQYEAIIGGRKQNYSMELTTTGAGTYLKDLFGVTESPFSSPKNIGFLKLLISLFENEPFTILDFFSGSATTADAVMRLNAENNGKRKFIMVQLPENLDDNLKKAKTKKAKQTIQSAISICDKLNKPHLLTEIGKERIRLAGKRIKKETDANIDTGFRVYKLKD